MTRRTDLPHSDLPPTARTRVRLPEPLAPVGLFQGWGPGLSGN
jgi:hypothetical protein